MPSRLGRQAHCQHRPRTYRHDENRSIRYNRGRMNDVFLFFSAFLASSVEMVEALTIVLAVGVTRGWRSPLFGVSAALGALAIVVAVLGPALDEIPLDTLRLVVGGLLLVFG